MDGGISTIAPLTRAQAFQWFLEKGLAEGVRSLPSSTAEAAQAVVDELERRFEILRTSLAVVDGELRQVVHDAGSPLSVVDMDSNTDLARCMATLVRTFKTDRQGREDCFLVQFFLIRSNEGHWLAVIADNTAVDAGFHLVMNKEITRILGSTAHDSVDGLQPREAAMMEHSPEGERERADAAAYLRRHFSIAPPRMHVTRPSSGINEGRYYRCSLTLSDADRILSNILATIGVLPSALVLAAFIQLMSWRSQVDSCSVNVSVDNRYNRELRRFLCATAQRVPKAFGLKGRTLFEAAAEVQATLADGYPTSGRYHPFDLITERVEAERRRGVCLTSDLAFNFVPPPQGWTALMESENTGYTAGGETTSKIRWASTDEVSYEYGVSLSVRWTDPQTARLSIHGDSDVLTPSQCEALLRGIELMVKRSAAGQDCVAATIASEAGLETFRRAAREQKAGERWIDGQAIEKRLLAMDTVDSAAVIVDPSGSRTVARVTTEGSMLTPFDLHAELLRAVETGEILVAPDWYEIDAGTGVSAGAGRAVPGRPAVTSEELAMRSAMEDMELDLDLSYLRAGGRLERYPIFAAKLRDQGFIPPGFAAVSGTTTLRQLARQLRRSEPTARLAGSSLPGRAAVLSRARIEAANPTTLLETRQPLCVWNRRWESEMELTMSEPVLTPEEVAGFWSDGFLVIQDVLTKEEADHFARLILDLVPSDLSIPAHWQAFDGRLKPFSAPGNQTFDGPEFIPLFQNVRLYHVMAQLLDSPHLLVRDGSLAITLRNDTPHDSELSQDLHLDPAVPEDVDEFLFTPAEVEVGGCFYFTDVEPGGGGIHVVPGGHRLVEREANVPRGRQLHDKWRNIPGLKTVEITANAGDFILMHHLMPHAASHNRLPKARVAQFLRYARNDQPWAVGTRPGDHSADRVFDESQLAAMTPLGRKLFGVDHW